MKSKITRGRVLIICVAIYVLMLSCLIQELHQYHGDFHVQGFQDINNNGLWDEGEPEMQGFTFVATMTTKPKVDSGESKRSITVPLGGAEFSLDAEGYQFDHFEVAFNFKVLNVPEGYRVGKIDVKTISSKKYTSPESQEFDEVYKILVSFIPDSTPTPTSTSTSTPTTTPLPTATFTPIPTITAELLGYGSYGYAMDFVQFKITNKPDGGTFLAVVDGKDYPCIFMTPTSDTLFCQGEPFPSGKYVDVVLYWNGNQIFTDQIFRAIPATPTKSGPD